jgi:altronate dehydratase
MLLMSDYAARAKAVRYGFEMNPSPGSLRGGLLTDAMESVGSIISGEKTIEQIDEMILGRTIQVASGEVHTKAELLGQDDFIPWKRGVSL